MVIFDLKIYWSFFCFAILKTFSFPNGAAKVLTKTRKSDNILTKEGVSMPGINRCIYPKAVVAATAFFIANCYHKQF